jgi:NADH-quinone oxidoreductase subunit B
MTSQSTSGKQPSLLTRLTRWSLSQSTAIYPFGMHCCSEILLGLNQTYDLSSVGMEWVTGSPQQADILMVMGPITDRQATRLQALYEWIPGPKSVLAVGSCCMKHGLATQGHLVALSDLMPVSAFVPGCPPRVDAVMDALLACQQELGER